MWSEFHEFVSGLFFRKPWLLPAVLFLCILGLIVIAAETSPVAMFIYPLF